MTVAGPSGLADDMISDCPACAHTSLVPLISVERIPTNSCLLLDSEKAARQCQIGALHLAQCPSCGFIANTAFDPAMTTYSTDYEETQGFSPRFRKFARDLASDWIERYGLGDRHVLEIGCGKGEFLLLLSELADVRGTGIDPAFVPERSQHDPRKLSFIQDMYDERYVDLQADAVVCRHTLEHLQDVRGFLRTIRHMVGDRHDLPVLFELPDSIRVLREVAFWDVYYEHCSYFTPGSLARLFRRQGFALNDLRLAFDEQYIIAEAFPAPLGTQQLPLAIEEDVEITIDYAAQFARSYQADLARRRADLDRWIAAGEHVVIWGAGSKGVAWLSSLGVTDEIRYAVDINPNKHDKYMAGTAQRIVGPEFLRICAPDRVVIMNPIYHEEITADLNRLGLDVKVVDA